MADESAPSLTDLVANGTMPAAIAATLATAAAERRSMLFVALPRLAGKTTTMLATLDHAPAGTAIHPLSRVHGSELGIPEQADGGYLLMSEISQAGFADYLWGDDVRRVFGALEYGFSLATALHAHDLDEAFEVIGGWNAVPDQQASRIDLAVYIEIIGDWRAPLARRIAQVREIEAVADRRPRGRVLFTWDRDRDRFEAVERPALIGSKTSGGIDARVERFAAAERP